MDKDEAKNTGGEVEARGGEAAPSGSLDRRKFLNWSWRVLGLGLVARGELQRVELGHSLGGHAIAATQVAARQADEIRR